MLFLPLLMSIRLHPRGPKRAEFRCSLISSAFLYLVKLSMIHNRAFSGNLFRFLKIFSFYNCITGQGIFSKWKFFYPGSIIDNV